MMRRVRFLSGVVLGLIVGLVAGSIWGMLIGREETYRSFCLDAAAERYISSEAMRGIACR